MYEVIKSIRHIKILLPLFIIGIFILVLGCILGFVIFPNKFKEGVTDNVVLEENTLQWYRFKESSLPLKWSMYFFSVENSDEINMGSKPLVKERGPYVYLERRVKHITRLARDTVNYNEVWSFEFDKEASKGNTEDDELLMINAPLLTLLQSLEDMPFALPYSIDEIVRDVFEQTTIFTRYKVRDFAFGGIKMCDPKRSTTGWSKFICLSVMLLQQKFISYEDDLSMMFALFHYKTEADGPFTLHRGIDDLDKLGLISAYKSKKYTSFWNGKNTECDKVEGHYTTFPPFMEKDTTWQVYSTDLCKAGTVHYTGETSFKDVSGYRFATNAKSFASPDQNCVCINVTRGLDGKSHCFSDGVLDLNTCFGGIPIILSFPHLMWAGKEYQESVLGLKEANEKYNVMIDFEPNIGFPLRGAIRIQFNIIMRPVEYATMGYFPDTEKLPRAMFPILWIEDSFELTDALIDELNSKLLNNLIIMEGVKWGFIAIGIFLVVLAIGFCIFYKSREQ